MGPVQQRFHEPLREQGPRKLEQKGLEQGRYVVHVETPLERPPVPSVVHSAKHVNDPVVRGRVPEDPIRVELGLVELANHVDQDLRHRPVLPAVELRQRDVEYGSAHPRRCHPRPPWLRVCRPVDVFGRPLPPRSGLGWGLGCREPFKGARLSLALPSFPPQKRTVKNSKKKDQSLGEISKSPEISEGLLCMKGCTSGAPYHPCCLVERSRTGVWRPPRGHPGGTLVLEEGKRRKRGGPRWGLRIVLLL
mmetsp:Transcript_2242/g.7494  ORF Transcript_2242/g.7494 Transcript_2242/m.7494 type:complete len:249 (+) Transcript_2242:947-1693(+)